MLALDDACCNWFCRGYALRHAARIGDVEQVRYLLLLGVNADIISAQQHRFFRPWFHGRPALWHAVSQGHMPVVDLLLRRGANPNLRGWMSNTPLWTACCMGRVDMVVRLLAAGADPNVKGAHNSSPLGAWMGSLVIPLAVDPSYMKLPDGAMEIGELLSHAGADMNEVDEIMAEARRLLTSSGYEDTILEGFHPLGALQSLCQAGALRNTVAPAYEQAAPRRV